MLLTPRAFCPIAETRRLSYPNGNQRPEPTLNTSTYRKTAWVSQHGNSRRKEERKLEEKIKGQMEETETKETD